MSASREKKQRQAGGEAMTQKELKERKEAQAAKRKTIIYWIVGIVVALLVAALLVWNSGIFQRSATAATVGDQKLSVSDMQYYYGLVRNNEIQQQQLYSQYGITMLTEPYVQYDSNSSLGDEQVYNTETNQTYADHFKEQALNNAKQVAALTQAAKAEGYTISAEAKSSLDQSISDLKDQVSKAGFPSFGAYLAQAYGSYVTEGVFKAQQTASALATDYYNHHSDSLSYSEEQLNTYADENPANVYSYDYRMCYISGTPETKKDDEGNTIEATDEEKAAAKAEATEKANTLVDGVKAASGDKSEAFNRLVVDAVPSGSSYATSDGNLKTAVLGSNISTSAYGEWLTSTDRKSGDIEAIASGDGYYVVLMLDRYLGTEPTVDVRHILVKAELTQDDPDTADVDESATAPTQEQMDAAKDKAQSILDEYNAGEKTADAFGALAEKYSEDGRDANGNLNTAGGLYTYVEQGQMVPNFDAWIFDASRKSGDTGLVENNEDGGSYFGWHVMYYQGQNGPKWHEVATNALKSEAMNDWLKGLEDACPAAYVGDQGPAVVTPSETPAPTETPSAD